MASSLNPAARAVHKAALRAYWEGPTYLPGIEVAVLREIVNHFKADYEIEEDVEDDWVISVRDIMQIVDELEGTND
jgi:hypothetical protein